MWTSSIAVAARIASPAGAAAGAEEDEQRPHPLAASGQRLPRVATDASRPARDGLAEPALDLGHPRR